MQQLFSHHNSIYNVQKLQLKIKYQAQQIEQFKSRIKHLESRNIQNLIQLLNEYINIKHTLDTSTWDKSAMEYNRKQNEIIQMLKQEIIVIDKRCEDEQKLRLKCQAQLLLANQIYLEQKQFYKEIIANYEQKIFDLRRLIQEKQCLIEIKSEYYEPNKQNFRFLKKYRENIDKIEDELIYSKCINNLQKKINHQKQLKKNYLNQIEELNQKLKLIQKIMKNKFSISLGQFILKNQIMEVVEENQILLDLNGNQERVEFESELILNEKQQIKYRGCCGDFICLLKKQLIKSKNMMQEVEIYKKIISDLKNSYSTVLNSIKDHQLKYKELEIKNKIYKKIILSNKINQNLIYEIDNFVDADLKKPNTKQLVIQMLKKNYRDLEKKISYFSNRLKYQNKKKLMLNRSFSCYNSIYEKVKYKRLVIKKCNNGKSELKSETNILPFIQELSQIQVSRIEQSDFKQYFKQQI